VKLVLCILFCRGLCDELIIHPKASYHMSYKIRETSERRRWPDLSWSMVWGDLLCKSNRLLAGWLVYWELCLCLCTHPSSGAHPACESWCTRGSFLGVKGSHSVKLFTYLHLPSCILYIFVTWC
jgi:hypothetical protein